MLFMGYYIELPTDQRTEAKLNIRNYVCNCLRLNMKNAL